MTGEDRFASIAAHLEAIRELAHSLINDSPSAPVTAIAAEQALEMDVRHAITDAGLFQTYLASDGGAVA